MKLKAVIFDFDGVILDSSPTAFEILREIAREENLKLKLENKIDWGLSGRKTLEKFLPGASWRGKLRVYQKWRAKELKHPIPIFANVLEVISTVKSTGLITGLLTNRSSRWIKFYDEKFDIDYEQIFDFIQTNEKRWKLFKKKIHLHHFFSYIYKPKRGCFAPALKFLAGKGIKKEEVIYVADTVMDFKATKQAGIGFVAIIGHGPLERVDFEKENVEYVLSSIEELPELIKDFK